MTIYFCYTGQTRGATDTGDAVDGREEHVTELSYGVRETGLS
jgi:hypothetical protein